MGDLLKRVNVFIASPGDVAAEREMVRDVCRELNADILCSGRGYQFRAQGWEDALPAAGRPQDIINQLVDRCDIFVCIFQRRFGTSTGKFDSGTEEEFWRAYENWATKEKPHILFYFKKFIMEDDDQENPEIRKIFQLKKAIKQNRLLLYNDFTSPEEFRQNFSDHLKSWIHHQPESNVENHNGTSANIVSTSEIPVGYYNLMRDYCAYMETDHLQPDGQAIRVELPEIFISIYADDPEKPADDDHEKIEGRRPKDVETLIAKYNHLLIEGHPGSGKTTLLKHLAYCLGCVGQAPPDLAALNEFKPVLIFLKDLTGHIETDETPSFEILLSTHFNQHVSKFSIDDIRTFLKNRKAIFLLDGLDEIKPNERSWVVKAFARLRAEHPHHKIVFSGRPHGLIGSAVDLFGRYHLKIMALNMDQVRLFVHKWFEHILAKSAHLGEKTAVKMIAEIKAHPATERLIDNPLMLTAICMLYYDGKELPSQRAELYKKFVTNMLRRRFDEPETIQAFLSALAFALHKKEMRDGDRIFAIDVLGKLNPKRKNETDETHRHRLEKWFDEIEPRCGLLKNNNGQHSFWHLTFQEYFSAFYMVDNHKDYGAAIKPYWGNPWYDEMIELYIGYLGIENKLWANDIVREALIIKDKVPFSRWRLAAKAFIDIHPKRRDKPVLVEAKNRLLSIFDTGVEPKVRAEAGETLGRLGDPRDLKKFIAIEDGRYKMGKTTDTIEPFEIGKYPVTNGWFGEFIKAKGYERRELWSPEGHKWLEHTKATLPAWWDEHKWNCPNHPVIGVSWYEADAFCRWLTLALKDLTYFLPDDRQWHAAAAGKKDREYPWEGSWEKGHCNTDKSKIGKTSAVGIFKTGETPERVADMAGNVWEWTRSDYYRNSPADDFKFDVEMQELWDEYFESRDEKVEEKLRAIFQDKHRQLPSLRGGSWDSSRNLARCSYRLRFDPDVRYNSIGFRCART